MMKIFSISVFLLAGLIAGTSAALGETSAATTSQMAVSVKKPSRWSAEGAVQAHSVAGSASPWVGVGVAYRVSDSANVGVRGFLPVAKTVDTSAYAIQALMRFRVSHGNNTDLFVEPDFAENFYKFLPFSSFGLGVGALNRVSSDLSVGIMGGFEFAHVVLDSYGLEHRSDLIMYPKIALLADFNF